MMKFQTKFLKYIFVRPEYLNIFEKSLKQLLQTGSKTPMKKC